MDASFLSQQVNAIIGQLHGLFDEIGVSNHEREGREEELFHALSEALHNQVRLVTAEKKTMVDEAQRTINAIRQMETALGDGAPAVSAAAKAAADEDLKVTYPLTRCLQVLKEKHLQISKLHRERFEQVKKLVDALESYSLHLESSFVRIALPPTNPNQSVPLNFDLSPAYVDQLDAEFTRVYEEYTRRVATVKATSEDMIQLWAELGTPQAQTDAAIVQHYRDAPEQLGLHEEDLARLRNRRDKLAEEKRGREKRLRDLRAAIETLWGKLGVDEAEQRAFLTAHNHRGCGLRAVNAFEDELARLNELKRQNLPAFVEDARCQLQELWDVLYLSEDEMLAFTPAFSDVYSDALLEAHEQEIARLQALREQRAPTLALVDRHQTLLRERADLAASSQDASRLMMRGQKGEKRDPGKLLREEKTRKRIAKELPKVAAELRRMLEAWEEEYGRPFLVHGERYLETIYEEEGGGGGGGGGGGPRSKTPANGGGGAAGNAKSATKHTPGKTGGGVRAVSARAGAKTPTAAATNAAAKRNQSACLPHANTATAANGRASPSRIPAATAAARAPLGTLKHGNNSPERQRAGGAGGNGGGNGSNMLRSAPVLMRAPPPKMRDLGSMETPAMANKSYSHHLASSVNVRHVEPEDVYDDRVISLHSNKNSNSNSNNNYATRSHSQLSHYSNNTGSSRPASQQQLHQQYLAGGSVASSVRQISNTSTMVSGSENWETYDDNSEPEPDASDAYYAKMRATARGGSKRMVPDGGHTYGMRGIREAGGNHGGNHGGGHGGGLGHDAMGGNGPTAKRLRAIPPSAPSSGSAAYAGHMNMTMVDMHGNRMVSGSEWTDEEAYLDE